MINEVTMYGATCDHCKNDWYDDHNGWAAMSDESTMKNQLSEDGWAKGDSKSNEGNDGEHYCPDCFEYDDDDNFILKPERKDKYLTNGTAAQNN